MEASGVEAHACVECARLALFKEQVSGAVEARDRKMTHQGELDSGGAIRKVTGNGAAVFYDGHGLAHTLTAVLAKRAFASIDRIVSWPDLFRRGLVHEAIGAREEATCSVADDEKSFRS